VPALVLGADVVVKRGRPSFIEAGDAASVDLELCQRRYFLLAVWRLVQRKDAPNPSSLELVGERKVQIWHDGPDYCPMIDTCGVAGLGARRLQERQAAGDCEQSGAAPRHHIDRRT
jgi:hypothetical protein